MGVCACFAPAAGAASLLALADIGEDYRLIVAQGAFTGRAFPATGTANAGFRFRAGLAGWRRWCEAGASHHSSASPESSRRSVRAARAFSGSPRRRLSGGRATEVSAHNVLRAAATFSGFTTPSHEPRSASDRGPAPDGVAYSSPRTIGCGRRQRRHLPQGERPRGLAEPAVGGEPELPGRYVPQQGPDPLGDGLDRVNRSSLDVDHAGAERLLAPVLLPEGMLVHAATGELDVDHVRIEGPEVGRERADPPVGGCRPTRKFPKQRWIPMTASTPATHSLNSVTISS